MEVAQTYGISEVAMDDNALDTLRWLLYSLRQVSDYEPVFIFLLERPWFRYGANDLPRLDFLARRNCRGLLSLLRRHAVDADSSRWRQLWRATRRKRACPISALASKPLHSAQGVYDNPA